MSKSVTITTAGEVRVTEWPTTSEGVLPHLYAEIQTDLVTTIPLTDGRDERTMWADDEGLLKADPVINKLANTLLGCYGPLTSYVAGHVVISGGVDAAGESLPLSDDEAEVLVAVLEGLRSEPLPQLVPVAALYSF